MEFKNKISVIISTRNRSNKIIKCLQSIIANRYKPYEIIIVDQSHNGSTNIKIQNFIKSYLINSIKYFKYDNNGLSNSRNFGIKIASGDIFAFTDDDCIVSPTWIKDLLLSFSNNPGCIGVFGSTKPYHPNKNSGKTCPCVITSNVKRVISTPCYHPKKIGFGNNMAFNRSIFSDNQFRFWLGVGSVGLSAEDGEFALRILSKGYKLLYNPKIIVYHNKWLREDQLRIQNLSYIHGEMACYGYYSFLRYKFAQEVIKNNWIDSYNDLKKIAGDVIKRKELKIYEWKYSINKFFFRLKGYFIGLFYYLTGEAI